MTVFFGGLSVVTDVKHEPDGSVVFTQKSIGCITQTPSGVIKVELDGDTDFSALPRDATGNIVCEFKPLGQAGKNFGRTLQAKAAGMA